MFKDHNEAGKKLAEELEAYRGQNAIVLAFPRGGVVIGKGVADALDPPLDMVAARKIRHPSSPEHAIGAVDENGMTVMNEADAKAVDQSWLKGELAREQKETRRRGTLRAFRASRGCGSYQNIASGA